jgi:hypothetical protein
MATVKRETRCRPEPAIVLMLQAFGFSASRKQKEGFSYAL